MCHGGEESQYETESQGGPPTGMQLTIDAFDVRLNISVCNAQGTDYDKTLYLPSFKPVQDTAASTEDLAELHELVWGLKQAMQMQRLHWNAESPEIESRALIAFVKSKQRIKVHTVDLGVMNQSAETEGRPLMLGAIPIGIWEMKTEVQTLRAYGVIADKIPSWIGELTQLGNLTLDGSRSDAAENHNSEMTQLPMSMGNMQRLKTIAL